MREHRHITGADGCIASLVNTNNEEVTDRMAEERQANVMIFPTQYYLGRLRPVSATLVESKAGALPLQAMTRRNQSRKPAAVNTPGDDAKEAEGEVDPDVEFYVLMRDDWLWAFCMKRNLATGLKCSLMETRMPRGKVGGQIYRFCCIDFWRKCHQRREFLRAPGYGRRHSEQTGQQKPEPQCPTFPSFFAHRGPLGKYGTQEKPEHG